MIAGTYRGPCDKLAGQHALLREDEDDHSVYLAQFDTNPLYVGGENLGTGWHAFNKEHFTLDKDAAS